MHATPISEDDPQRGIVAAWAQRAHHGLGRLLGLPVALLVAAEIAVLLGYSEPSVFFRAFRQWTGKTPGEYRQQLARRPAAT